MSHKNAANTTHRKRLARRLSTKTGMPYQQALDRVASAAEAGLLPSPLDPAGMDAAVAALLAMPTIPEPTGADAQTARPLETAAKVHKARPNPAGTHCAVCMQPVKQVPGGQGTTWVHTETGAVAAPGPDAPPSTITVDTKHEALALEGTGLWIAEAFSDEDTSITLHRKDTLRYPATAQQPDPAPERW